MRIAFSSQIFLDQKYGGISRYFTKVCEELDKEGEEIKIFAPFYRNEYMRGLPDHLYQGLAIPDIPHQVGKIVERINLSLGKSRMRKWRPDVVHETFFHLTGAAPQGVPVVVTVYDMIHELFTAGNHPKDTTTVRKRAAILRADHVICISENTRKDLISLFDLPKEKISVTHLAFDRPSVMAGSDDDRKPRSGRPMLLYVGQRSGYKNFKGILQSFAASARLRGEMELVAFGGGSFTGEEREEIRKLGLEQVRQVDGGDEVLARLYCEARVFVYPSLYEGFGLPPLEAMSYGCPVASSNTSSMPEVLGDAAEFFDPSDIGQIGTALERAAFDDARRSELITKGTKQLENFSWKKCAEETLAVYRKLV